MIINYGPCIVYIARHSAELYTLTVISSPSGADIELTAPGYSQIGNTITVPMNTHVNCELYLQGYVPYSTDILVQADRTETITLEQGVLFTINPTPNDATITFIIDGTEYSEVGLNALEVPINRQFGYRVEKENYKTASDTLTITEATTINVELKPYTYSSDYEYTVQTDNSAILTKYIGTNPVVVGPDYVKGDL